MNHDQVLRQDFPTADDGYDRASVDAHLAAVAAAMNALEVQISGFEVERDALRRQAAATSRQAEVEVISKRTAAHTPARPYETAEHKIVEGTVNKGEVSARLIATKMALDGEDRETIKKRLETYELENADALLDDVIAKVG
ncbi:MAG: DivIVA domain-containing protein [Solirubrobacterales bacterium]|nr:DivIVA domain-containing protein [Solirubrobacterales bacterium]